MQAVCDSDRIMREVNQACSDFMKALNAVPPATSGQVVLTFFEKRQGGIIFRKEEKVAWERWTFHFVLSESERGDKNQRLLHCS